MISTIQKFISINNSNLTINNLNLPKNKDIFVLSIIGKARTGKSSLLNCLISSIISNTTTTTNLFQTSDSDEHCTHGVDACYIEYDNKIIVILDVQGIEYHDSSLDTKMLLIIYLISNLIIFNEKNLISNATLQSLLPLTTFISCLELSSFNKPDILFRISDCDLTLEPMEHLNKTLKKRKDQYQNIRETIYELFKNI
jgi:ribosome biogenesis GTPase A